MDNYIKITKSGINFPQLPRLVSSLNFDRDTWRQDAPTSAHKATRSVYLRTVSELNEDNIFNELLATTTDMGHLPWCQELMRWLQKELRLAVLGRVMFVELTPKGFIESHVDSGEYCANYNRYHLPVTTNQHCAHMVGDVASHMEVGNIYQIANKQTHCAWNYGTTPRIHLIFDAIPFKGIDT